jgi:NAD(P)H dehydrogenase (quinone)
MNNAMKVLIVYAHSNPMSFTKAILDNFVKGLKEAGHRFEIIDLYKIRFNPVFQDMDFSFFVDKNLPKDLFQKMDIRKMIISLAGGPFKRFVARWYIKNKTDDELINLINSQKPKDVLIQQKKVSEADVLVFITQVFWMHFPAIVKGWMERVLTYGFAYVLNENGWKGDPDGRIPLLKIKKALIMQPTFFNEKIYREKGFTAAMEKTIDEWSLKYPGIENVEHVYFYSVVSVSPETRKKYLEMAYLKGKDLQ